MAVAPEVKRAAMAFVARSEGGLAEIKGDAGGFTGYGVSLAFLKAHGIDIDGDGDTDRNDILMITPQKAEELFDKYFWTPLRCGDMPPAIAVVLYDAGINQGTGYAARALQRAAGVTVDGVIGDGTLAGVHKNPAKVLLNLCVDRMFRYMTRPLWNTCKLGWTRRLFGAALLAGRYI